MAEKKTQKAVTKEMWKRQVWKLPWLLLIPIGLLLPKLAGQYPDFIETQYAQGLYPKISDALGGASASLPGSIAELIVYLLVALLVGCVILLITHLLQRRQKLVRLVSFLLSLCIAAGVMINLMYWLWGFNYARPTLGTQMNLEVKSRSYSELKLLCDNLSSEANQLRSVVSEDENGIFKLTDDITSYFRELPAAYASLGQAYPMFSRKTYPAKSVYASEAMSYAGISGIFIPYTAEANVNVHQPPLLLLSAAAHETAHYLGVAKEDEANFVAYLACMQSDIPSIRYSGVMLALIHATKKLKEVDENAFTLVRSTYSDGMIRDLENYNAYWDKHEGKIEEKVNEINDAYLKHNQQENGVESYGMMVDLLLAYYAQ